MSEENPIDSGEEREIKRLEARAGGMLPGIAAISLFMIFMTILNAFAALRGEPPYATAAARYSVLGICTLLGVGVFGLLKLRKWGWAIVTAGTLLLSSGDFFIFEKTKAGFNLIRALLVLVFFLYLVRGSVRDRLR